MIIDDSDIDSINESENDDNDSDDEIYTFFEFES